MYPQKTLVSLTMTDEDVKNEIHATYENDATATTVYGIYKIKRQQHPELTPFEAYKATLDYVIAIYERQETQP